MDTYHSITGALQNLYVQKIWGSVPEDGMPPPQDMGTSNGGAASSHTVIARLSHRVLSSSSLKQNTNIGAVRDAVPTTGRQFVRWCD